MYTIKYSRPFINYDEQISKLENDYNLIINDKEFAKFALSNISYYDLVNGYQENFMINQKYIPNITIEYLFSFHLFNKDFQNILFKQSLFIENMFKSHLSYVISDSYGVDVNIYLDENNFLFKKDTLYFNSLKPKIEKSYKSKWISNPTKHYINNHNHLPPWILFKNISFSNSINLFTLLKPNEKSKVVNFIMPGDKLIYKDKVDFVTKSLNLIRDYRNTIAHNLKFVTYKYDNNNKHSPNIIIKLASKNLLRWSDINKHSRGLNDIYAMIISIIYLLNDEYLIYKFLEEIYSLISHENNNYLFNDYSLITNLPKDLMTRINLFLQNDILKN